MSLCTRIGGEIDRIVNLEMYAETIDYVKMHKRLKANISKNERDAFSRKIRNECEDKLSGHYRSWGSGKKRSGRSGEYVEPAHTVVM